MKKAGRSKLFSGVLAFAGGLAAARIHFAPGPWRPAAVFLVAGLCYPAFCRRQAGSRRRRLQKETALWLLTLMMAVEAGSSIQQALEDLSAGLAAGRSEHAPAWERLRNGLALNRPPAVLLEELGNELGSGELKSLSLMLKTSIRCGTDLAEVFCQAAGEIRQGLEAEEELRTFLAQRRLEGTMLAAAPAAFVFLLRLLAPGYMAPLFTGQGAVLMFFVLLLEAGGGYLFYRLFDRRQDPGRLLAAAAFQQDMALALKAGMIAEDAWGLAAGLCLAEGAAEKGREARGDPFREDVKAVQRGIGLGLPFGQALGLVSADREAKSLSSMLRENQRFGSSRIYRLLQAGAAEGRRRCLMEIKSGGARRETWLLFPMIVMLASALLVTGAPALLELGASW